ncbi:uncharacterized protein PV09_05139 [Verruconis gallopava]|uniref:NAD(P)-binding protein n=1 Tax=Verruconis gallopava TaxID=253628 RepID=A0A0D2AB66_9PEZI|nr:uncharacterized protein PV09_05139 [Verruconis gallopava]KIW03840.1 hypothetical protein PV09_05139 [Verruconis gallopava]
MTEDLRKLSGATFAIPLHKKPEGATDPTKVTLPPNFTVAIAGASKGIGLGIAKAYARARVSGLVLSARSQDALELAAREVLKINPRIKLMCQACDVTDEEAVKGLAEATKTAFGRLDVLVISAGKSAKASVKRENGLMDWPSDFREQSPSELESMWRLNVHAPFVLLHHFLPLLECTQGGAKAVVQLSSAAAHYTQAEVMAASYSLTKMAATRLIEHCHEAHKGRGIVAFALQPGGVKTDFAAEVPQGKGWEDRLTEDVELAGAVCVWLTKERREWLSGRYVDSRWDFDELESKKDLVVGHDLLKFRMKVE